MVYCTKCGVELDPDMVICPVCNQPVSGKEKFSEHVEEKGKTDTSYKKLSAKRMKRFLTDRIPPFKRIFHI